MDTKILNDLTSRSNFIRDFSWHKPSQSLVDLLKTYSPIVSVGSGYGYTEHIAKKQGVDIVATDLTPGKNKYCQVEKSFLAIEKISAIDAVKKYHNRNVFMAWPPYANPMAFDVVKSMEKNLFLIYVGESFGGCTGDDNFFNYLNKNFKEIDHNAQIERWYGLHDYVFLFKKIKK